MEKRKGQASKYVGILNEPIFEPIQIEGMLTGLLSNPPRDPLDPFQEAKRRAISRQKEKLLALFDLYKIPSDENEWMQLAYALACEHVPGFKVNYAEPPKTSRKRGKGAGSKRIWTPGLYKELFLAVESIRAEKGITDKAAVDQLIKDRPKWGRGYSGFDNLYNHYKTAKVIALGLTRPAVRRSPVRKRTKISAPK